MAGKCLIILGATLMAANAGGATLIFEDDFETLDEAWWQADIRGEGSIEIVEGGVEGKCLRITSDGGHVYLTARLDPERFAGARLTMTGMVKLEDCGMGAEIYSTPKFHFAHRAESDNDTFNAADRWIGSFDWTQKTLSVNVPDDCSFLVMDIGNQNGTGTFYVDDFKLEDEFGSGRPISLLPACNTGRSDGVADDGRGSFLDTGPLDLYFLPEGRLDAGAVSFYLPRPGDNGGQVMIALQGGHRPDLPAATEPITVNKKAASLCFLHAAAWAGVGGEEPCYTAEVRYADGATQSVEMVAGRDIANFDDPKELANFRPAWTGMCAAGETVGVGSSVWENPRPDVAIESIALKSSGKGVPLILALTYKRPG